MRFFLFIIVLALTGFQLWIFTNDPHNLVKIISLVITSGCAVYCGASLVRNP